MILVGSEDLLKIRVDRHPCWHGELDRTTDHVDVEERLRRLQCRAGEVELHRPHPLLDPHDTRHLPRAGALDRTKGVL